MTPPAMIFAAGFGTRMGELTKTTPKPMLSLGGRPMVDHTIDILREAGITRIVGNTHYRPENLERHFEGQGVIALREDPILETGGGLRAALPHLGEGPVLTINPDAYWSGPNPVAQLLSHWQDDMSALLLLVQDADGIDSDFSIEHGQIHRNGPYKYTGLQMLRTERLAEIEQDVFSLNVYWDLLIARRPIHGLVYDGDWMDIGTPQGLADANRRFTR